MQAVCKCIKTIQQRIVFLVHAIKKMKRESVLWQLCQAVIDFQLVFFTFFFILLLYLNLDFQTCFPMKTTFSKSGADCLTLDWNEKPLPGFFLIHHTVQRWCSCPAGSIQFIVHPSPSGCVMGVALFVLFLLCSFCLHGLIILSA